MFKKIITLFAVAAVSIASSQAQLQLPAPSPAASVKQTAGLTEITIDYSSPGVKGRTVFGDLVPYNQIWRTGANGATTINFSKDVTIEGTKVAQGKYSIFTIPGASEFVMILNKDVTASADSYKKEDDVVRINVKPRACEFRERLAFMFSNFSDNQLTVDMEWEKTRVSFTVNLDTDTQAKGNIDRELGRTWRTYNSAARYYLDNNKELETGLKYADQSISLKDEWFNNWSKAQILAAMNNKSEAYKFALKAKELGDKNVDGFFYKTQVEKAIVDWKSATPVKGKK
jgi:Protein of unknown function (DUF2911)